MDMSSPRFATVLGIALAGGLSFCPVAGAGIGGLLEEVRTPASFREWSIDDPVSGGLEVSELRVPLNLTFRLGDRARLLVAEEYVSARARDAAGNSTSLQAVADFSAQGYLWLWEERILLVAGMRLPARHGSLSVPEMMIVQTLSHPVLGFPSKHFGGGLDLNLGSVLTLPIRDRFLLSLGTGVARRGEYSLLAESSEYRPAPTGSIVVGVRYEPEERGIIARLEGTYRAFGEDRLEARPIFREGNQVEMQVSTEMRAGRVGLFALARMVTKSPNRIMDASGESPDRLRSEPGTSWQIYMSTTAPLRSRVAPGIDAEFSRLQGGGTDGQNGAAFGIGPRCDITLGSAMVTVSGQRLFGFLESGAGSGERSPLRGTSFAVTLRWRTES
jgi:hypothetical protein